MWKAKRIALHVLIVIMVLSLLSGISQPFNRVRADASTDDWPMFRYDLNRTGYTSSTAPNTNRTLEK